VRDIEVKDMDRGCAARAGIGLPALAISYRQEILTPKLKYYVRKQTFRRCHTGDWTP